MRRTKTMGLRIEHKIRDSETGRLRRLKKGDLDFDKHAGVRAAFKVVYEMQKHYELQQKTQENDKSSSPHGHEPQKKEIL